MEENKYIFLLPKDLIEKYPATKNTSYPTSPPMDIQGLAPKGLHDCGLLLVIPIRLVLLIHVPRVYELLIWGRVGMWPLPLSAQLYETPLFPLKQWNLWRSC